MRVYLDNWSRCDDPRRDPVLAEGDLIYMTVDQNNLSYHLWTPSFRTGADAVAGVPYAYDEKEDQWYSLSRGDDFTDEMLATGFLPRKD